MRIREEVVVAVLVLLWSVVWTVEVGERKNNQQ
jgi:hypothetical protein